MHHAGPRISGHAVSNKPPAFNGLFYATVATIIPVLFLAIAVQGTSLKELLSAAERAAQGAADSRIGFVKGDI